jgi:hypothetical protein
MLSSRLPPAVQQCSPLLAPPWPSPLPEHHTLGEQTNPLALIPKRRLPEGQAAIFNFRGENSTDDDDDDGKGERKGESERAERGCRGAEGGADHVGRDQRPDLLCELAVVQCSHQRRVSASERLSGAVRPSARIRYMRRKVQSRGSQGQADCKDKQPVTAQLAHLKSWPNRRDSLLCIFPSILVERRWHSRANAARVGSQPARLVARESQLVHPSSSMANRLCRELFTEPCAYWLLASAGSMIVGERRVHGRQRFGAHAETTEVSAYTVRLRRPVSACVSQFGEGGQKDAERSVLRIPSVRTRHD